MVHFLLQLQWISRSETTGIANLRTFSNNDTIIESEPQLRPPQTTNTTPLPSEDIEEEEEKEVEKEEYNEDVNLPWKLLGGWQINTRIMSLEKEIAEFNRQIADQKIAQKNAGFHKRKIDETECLLEGGGTGGHNYGYSMSPQVLHGPVAGSINGNVVGSLAGPVGGVAMGGPGAGISPSPQGGSYAGGHGGSRVDSIPGQIGSHAGQLYGSCGNAYRPTPYMESSKGLSNTIPGDSNRPPPQLEVSSGLPNTIPGNAYRPRPPPYLEGSTGLPNTTPPPHQFANTVPAAELSQSSGSEAVDAPAEIVLRWQDITFSLVSISVVYKASLEVISQSQKC
ncbi:hypothetical protein K7X08_031930 [Anisodus acutangulus]|uniref:Uncharacterized protein n=1 Tax=Anisodus acutangulus TaxID=402998 RepID=A0A9Q1RJS4_9SOLA|nr:hypothetical protein K7X08_031930 [Anisodus acutangulus]